LPRAINSSHATGTRYFATMNKEEPLFVAGHRGLVGAAIVRALRAAGRDSIITRTRAELDLREQSSVDAFFASERPKLVFLAAARVGGIHANEVQPADFLRDNLQIQTNVIDAAWRHGVRKFCFLGSSCIYPRLAAQPMREEYLLTGALEPTNEWYAIAKIAGIKMCQAYRRQYQFNAISLMPTNLYGPGDNFSLEQSHVLPAMIRKFHGAKMGETSHVALWGTGTPRREFLHVDDLARACLFLMDHYDSPEIINVGTGQDISIAELARLVGQAVGYSGGVEFDSSRPDGTPRKLLDVTRLTQLGWQAQIPLAQGIRQTYEWYLEHENTARQ
jgi:GDP-L-fucose synthase